MIWDNLVIAIELTDFCNAGCIFCDHVWGNNIHKTKARFMEKKLIFKIIDDITPAGYSPSCLSLNWLGESLMHPDIFEILEYIKNSSLKNVHINTNGMALTPDLIDKLLATPAIKRIRISLDAITSKTYQLIKSRSNVSLKTILNNIVYFMKVRKSKNLNLPQLVFSFVICNENKSEAGKFYKFFQNLCKEFNRKSIVTYDFFIPEENSNKDVIDFYMLLAPEQTKATKLYYETLYKIGIIEKKQFDGKLNQCFMINKRFEEKAEIDTSKRRPCSAIFRMANIHSSGKFTLCCHDQYLRHIMGDLNTQSFFEIWEGRKFNDLRLSQIRGDFTKYELCSMCGNMEYFSVSDYKIFNFIKKFGSKQDELIYRRRMGIKTEADYEKGHN